ncbi:N-lysine methyltransferase smyd2 [Balamuthia mandrillaris]
MERAAGRATANSCSFCCASPPAQRLLRCGRCKQAWYCDQECQKKAWPAHKASCKPPDSPVAPPPPKNVIDPTKSSSSSSAAAAHAVPPQLCTADYWREKRKQVPRKEDFPNVFPQFQWVPSKDGQNENLLLLFHGLGDDHTKFAGLAETMSLPQTCALALTAPLALPLDCGHAWYPYFEDDGTPIKPMQDANRRRWNGLLDSVCELTLVLRVLHNKYGWPFNRIFLLGFSQGAVVAVNLALCHYSNQQQHGHLEKGRLLGGVVAISDSLLEEQLMEPELLHWRNVEDYPSPARIAERKEVPMSPMLITHGKDDEMHPIAKAREKVRLLRNTFYPQQRAEGTKSEKEEEWNGLVWREYPGKGHQMPNSEVEGRDLMTFFSKHLYLRNVALEQMKGLVELRGATSS